MRKFGITAFAVLYAILIIGATAERSNTWAARQAEVVSHSEGGRQMPAVGKALQSDTYLSQKKRVETEFVIELPREAVLVPDRTERHNPLASFEFHANLDGQPYSSRSPPACI